MAEYLTCNCGRHEIDQYEVRILHDGVHCVSSCDLEVGPNG